MGRAGDCADPPAGKAVRRDRRRFIAVRQEADRRRIVFGGEGNDPPPLLGDWDAGHHGIDPAVAERRDQLIEGQVDPLAERAEAVADLVSQVYLEPGQPAFGGEVGEGRVARVGPDAERFAPHRRRQPRERQQRQSEGRQSRQHLDHGTAPLFGSRSDHGSQSIDRKG
nr:hypothetical protein [Skermanella pratensis]